MDLNRPDRRETLAAEYVLGTLRGRARRRFERLIAKDPMLAAEVAFWAERLAQLGDAGPEVAPPAEDWRRLERRLGLLPEVAGRPQQAGAQRGGRRDWLKRAATGVALAASLVVAFAIGQRYPESTAWSPLPVLPREEALPMFVTLLREPQERVSWLVSLSPDRRSLSVEASRHYDPAIGVDVELWCISPGRPPVALGVLPKVPGAAVALRVPKGIGVVEDEGLRFAVTLEQKGGSPTGRPTGPVLVQTAVRGTI